MGNIRRYFLSTNKQSTRFDLTPFLRFRDIKSRLSAAQCAAKWLQEPHLNGCCYQIGFVVFTIKIEYYIQIKFPTDFLTWRRHRTPQHCNKVNKWEMCFYACGGLYPIDLTMRVKKKIRFSL